MQYGTEDEAASRCSSPAKKAASRSCASGQDPCRRRWCTDDPRLGRTAWATFPAARRLRHFAGARKFRARWTSSASARACRRRAGYDRHRHRHRRPASGGHGRPWPWPSASPAASSPAGHHHRHRRRLPDQRAGRLQVQIGGPAAPSSSSSTASCSATADQPADRHHASAGVLLFAGAAAGRAGALHPGEHHHRLHQRHRGADRPVAAADLMGLKIDKLPADFFAQIGALWGAPGSFNPRPRSAGLLRRTLPGAAVRSMPRRADPGLEGHAVQARSRVPGPVVALVTTTRRPAAAPAGGNHRQPLRRHPELPALALPPFSWESAKQLVIPTVTIALLGAIESLLCARGRRPDRHAAPRPQPGADGAGRGQLRGALLSAAFRPRHHRAHRHQRAPAPPARWPAWCTRSRCWVVVLAAAGLAQRAAGGAGGHPAVRGLEHGRVARVRAPEGTSAPVPHHPRRHLPADGDLRPHGGGGGGPGATCLFFIYRMSTLFRVTPHAAGKPGAAGRAGVRAVRLAVLRRRRQRSRRCRPSCPQGTRAVVLEMHRLISLDTSGLEALEQLHATLKKQGIGLVAGERERAAAVADPPFGLQKEIGASRSCRP